MKKCTLYTLIFLIHLFIDVPEVCPDVPDQPLLPSGARIAILVVQVLPGSQSEGLAWCDDLRGNRLNHLLQVQQLIIIYTGYMNIQ